jgi:diguanylate cyclase (GGDEF)-like protein
MKTRRPVTPRSPLFTQPVVILEPSANHRLKLLELCGELGYVTQPAIDTLSAQAFLDGAGAVIAAHPYAADLYTRLRSEGLPFIVSFLSREKLPAQLARDVGADAYLTHPYRRDPVALALYAASGARLHRDRAVRAELALADVSGVQRREERSGLLHIDLFKTLLPLEIRRARRHGYPVAICVVSLDPLPNAEQVSEDVVTACEPLVRSAVRDVDLTVRYGDGRFLVFLPHTDERGAEAVGKRIVQAVRDTRLRSGGVTRMVTASVGIAAPRDGKPPSFARLIRDAHAAVKAAQLKGGDRAILR